MFVINDIRHTGIVVNKLDKSLWFYKEKMGFKIFKQMDESGRFIDQILGFTDIRVTTVKMMLNNQMIELLDFSTHKKILVNKSIIDNGPTHLAFTVENLNEIYEDFIDNDIEFISSPKLSTDGKVRVAFCKAPEGTFIELVELQ